MRAAKNNTLGESVGTGATVDVNGNKATIYDDGAKWSVVQNEDGTKQLVQQIPSNVSPDLMAYVQQKTGDTYSWSPAQNLALNLGIGNSSGSANPYAQANCAGAQCSVVMIAPSLPTPDYLSVSVNLYLLSGGAAINLHNGDTFGQWGLGRSYPGYSIKPGGAILFGSIIGGTGAESTSTFLKGAGIQGSTIIPFPLFPLIGGGGGINHGYGGATSIEYGIGTPGISVTPVGYGFDLKKSKK